MILPYMVSKRFALAWGRHDPDSARNRLMQQSLEALGWTVSIFRPRLSCLGDVEAMLCGLPRPDLVWLPGFRQRDALAAHRWCRRHQVPLMFDPLISAYSKQIFERKKFVPGSAKAERLRRREAAQFGVADLLLADTLSHATFFAETFAIPPKRIHVVPLGAEEQLFFPTLAGNRPDAPFEVLFFGSFIPLHGAEIVAQAACQYRGPAVRWRFLGKGPFRATCEQILAGRADVVFEDWKPYREIPGMIARADLVLGNFGSTLQAERAISNKVYQALACGRPVITRTSRAFPDDAATGGGMILIPPGDPAALAHAVEGMVTNRAGMPARNQAARALYEAHYSRTRITSTLEAAIQTLFDKP